MAKKTSKSGKTKNLSAKPRSNTGQGLVKSVSPRGRRLFIFGSGILAIALALVLFLIFGIDRQIVLAVPKSEIGAWTKVLAAMADSPQGKSKPTYSVRLVPYEDLANVPPSTLIERPLERIETASVPLFAGDTSAKDAAISRLLPGLRGIVEGPEPTVLPIAVDPWLLFYRRDLGRYNPENAGVAASSQPGRTNGRSATPASSSGSAGLIVFPPFWEDFARMTHPRPAGKQRIIPLLIPGRDDAALWIDTLSAHPDIGSADAAARDLDAKSKAGLIQNNWRAWNREDVIADLSAQRGAATAMSLGTFYRLDPVESVVFEAAPFPGTRKGGLRILPAQVIVIVSKPDGARRPGQAAFLRDLLSAGAQTTLAESTLRLGAAEGLPPRDAAGQVATQALSGPARIVIVP